MSFVLSYNEILEYNCLFMFQTYNTELSFTTYVSCSSFLKYCEGELRYHTKICTQTLMKNRDILVKSRSTYGNYLQILLTFA